MQGLFSPKNMLLCDIQRNKYELLVKTIKNKFPKSPVRPAGFSFTKISIESKVSLKIMSQVSISL